ncbi:MAG: hypothetical protein JNJ91_05130 [Flavobacteriales bacterium]|nr:hypothetical protein [Flavobacteriales bacterium]
MSDQELSELLSHPRVRAYLERVAERAAERVAQDVAARAFATMWARLERLVRPRPKPAAEGDLNYAAAAILIGCPDESVRYYAHKGDLKRGTLPATVTLDSCIEFKRTYNPRPSGRTSGKP